MKEPNIKKLLARKEPKQEAIIKKPTNSKEPTVVNCL